MSAAVAFAWVLIVTGTFERATMPAPSYFATKEACEVAAEWVVGHGRRARCFPTGATP